MQTDGGEYELEKGANMESKKRRPIKNIDTRLERKEQDQIKEDESGNKKIFHKTRSKGLLKK